jgi:prevent-host-death family protein
MVETEIGSFEAKTRLAELLREAERGRSFLITRRGKVVARLGPASGPAGPVSELPARFREVRDRIGGTVDVLELTEEGRRY